MNLFNTQIANEKAFSFLCLICDMDLGDNLHNKKEGDFWTTFSFKNLTEAEEELVMWCEGLHTA